jgi:hypothetical protein
VAMSKQQAVAIGESRWRYASLVVLHLQRSDVK